MKRVLSKIRKPYFSPNVNGVNKIKKPNFRLYDGSINKIMKLGYGPNEISEGN